MITIRKLESLKAGTRHRKYISILKDLEENLKNNNTTDLIYLKSLYKLIQNDFPNIVIESNILNIREINSIRHKIMSSLNLEPAEWDFYSPRDNYGNRKTLPINILCEDIRSPFNLGSIFRTAECFGVKNIYITKDTTDPGHERCKRTSMGCTEIIPWEIKKPVDITGPLFALELGGTGIKDFNFPKNGTVIIGSEELGVSAESLRLCKKNMGIVTIPLIGGKSSLNVANAFSILLQRWSEHILKG
jgi:RNA methyltransferase, TrmH family